MKLTAIVTILIMVTLILASQVSLGDMDDDDDYKFWQKKPGVNPVSNALYQDECGSCHFAYQPGLLPSRSWQKLMGGLEDHFGDNAELDPADQQAISSFLDNNGADKSSFRRSTKIMRSLGNSQTPFRITEVPYIVHKHDEIPSRLVNNNPKVGSLSHCDKCHQTVSKGSFSERDISIPGFGKWDD